MTKNYRVFYWYEKEGNTAVGIEEVKYREGEAEVFAQGSVFIEGKPSVVELFSKIVEEYCDRDAETIKILSFKKFKEDDYKALMDRFYPKVRFYRTQIGENDEGVKELCFEALETENSYFVRL
nr:hypothetical protein [Neobacillus sp. Marseille-Q6967]